MIGSTVLTLIFDCGLGILLIATIAYCSKLSKRIRMLQDGRSEFAEMLGKFDTATNRAIASVTELQTISKRMTDALQLKIEKANFLADDLAFLIEKSNKLIVQLEQMKLSTDKPAPVQQHPRPKPSADILQILSSAELNQREAPETGKQEASLVPRTGAERELLAALKTSGTR